MKTKFVTLHILIILLAYIIGFMSPYVLNEWGVKTLIYEKGFDDGYETAEYMSSIYRQLESYGFYYNTDNHSWYPYSPSAYMVVNGRVISADPMPLEIYKHDIWLYGVQNAENLRQERDAYRQQLIDAGLMTVDEGIRGAK